MTDSTDPLQAALAEIERLKRENARLAELLDMAQEFGRVGVWERDPKTLEGRWDAHVFRFFGFEPGATPHFSEAAARVHPDDRLDHYFKSTLVFPGAHSHRYRIRRPDGTVAHVHSQWRVIAGADGRAERVVGVLVDDTEAHALAQQVEAERTRLSLALSLAGIGLWHYDIERQRIFHDAQTLASLGRVPDPDGTPLDEVRSWIHPDDVAEVRMAMERTLANGGPVDTQTRYRHADGSWRSLLTRRVLQRDSAGRPLAVLGVGMDVTEQQRHTQETFALARRLDAAAEAAEVGLWSSPLDGQPPEWNAQMFRLLGLDPARGALRLGDSLRELAHPDDRDRAAAPVLAWMRGSAGRELTIAMRIRWPRDGATRWIEVRGRQEKDADGVPRASGVMLDVTEQHEALERLREAHQRTSLALDAAGMGSWSHDVASGHDDWDERMFRLRGLDPSLPVPGEAARMALVLSDDHASLDAASLPFLESAEPLDYEFRIRRADDGRVRTLASRSIALTDEHGRVARRIGVNWDVTEARQLEAAQREAELALRESRAKSALFARISHELRTPLNAVLGLTQLMQADDARLDDVQRRVRLAQVRAAGQTLLELVDGVLELGDAVPKAVPAGDEPAKPAGGTDVLYIEDNEVNMLIVRELLAQRPHLVFHGAPDGERGLLRARELRPALVLIDMQLPGIDGMEVMRRLRADPATARSTLIALSANAMHEDRRRALAAGFDAYWTKPIDLMEFLKELDARLPTP